MKWRTETTRQCMGSSKVERQFAALAPKDFRMSALSQYSDSITWLLYTLRYSESNQFFGLIWDEIDNECFIMTAYKLSVEQGVMRGLSVDHTTQLETTCESVCVCV